MDARSFRKFFLLGATALVLAACDAAAPTPDDGTVPPTDDGVMMDDTDAMMEGDVEVDAM